MTVGMNESRIGRCGLPGMIARWCAAAVAGLSLALVGPACSTKKVPPPPKLETQQDYEQAIAAARKGDELRKKSQWAPAAEAYKESLAIKPDLGPAWLNLGYCLLQIGDLVPARDAFVHAVDLMPSDPRPYENLGILYHSRGWDEEAMRAFVESLKIDPTYLPSLRGACLTAKSTRVVSYAALDRVNQAILAERQPEYLRVWQAERFRLTQALKDRERDGS